jgi:hypothetical protein
MFFYPFVFFCIQLDFVPFFLICFVYLVLFAELSHRAGTWFGDDGQGGISRDD